MGVIKSRRRGKSDQHYANDFRTFGFLYLRIHCSKRKEKNEGRIIY